MEYTAIIKQSTDGMYIAQCEQIPAAITQGKTLEEVDENLKDAIALVLECEQAEVRKQNKGLDFITRKIAIF